MFSFCLILSPKIRDHICGPQLRVLHAGESPGRPRKSEAGGEASKGEICEYSSFQNLPQMIKYKAAFDVVFFH